MEPRHLRYFVAVAEEGSFTRAAARLHISQQALSAAVRRLEAQVGRELLERTPGRVVPTGAGRALLARAPAVFAAMEAAAAAVDEAAGIVSGPLDLRYGLDSEAFVEPLLAGFQERRPAVAVRAWTGMDADNHAALRRGDVHAVFAWAAVPGDLTAVVVSREQALLALPDRHRLARLAAIPAAELADEPLVMFPRDAAPAVWDHLVARLRPAPGARAAPIRQTPVSGQGTMAEAVLRGDGVCPVSQTLAERLRRPGLVLRPLEPPLTVPLLLAWRGEPLEPLRALVDDLGARGPADVG